MQRITLADSALVLSILFGIGLLAFGYNLAGFDVFVRWFLFFGLFWLVALYNRWNWFSGIALILTVLASALGLWLGLHTGWMIGASIFSLVAWDLTEFHSQIRTLPKNETNGLAWRHLARLCILALAGLALATLLVLLRGQLTLDWEILLAAMTVVSVLVFLIGKRAG